MSAIKRVLPFALTLLVGTALGSIGGFFHTHPDNESPHTLVFESHSCRAHYNPGPQTSSDSSQLVLHFKPEPQYTEAARKDQISGVVRLRMVFGADGKVSNIESLATLPDGLTEEAMRAAKRIQFTPATINGEPISVTRVVDFNFDLYDSIHQSWLH